MLHQRKTKKGNTQGFLNSSRSYKLTFHFRERWINDEETIQLDANCSVIIQRRLPKKEQDLGRVSLPVAIGTIDVRKALLDLGSIINLTSLSVAKRVGDLCIKRTRMTLQLADKSFAKPLGMAVDVLVKVDKFVFPTDFVVMDIEDDEALPLLLGRNFMQMARMMIDRGSHHDHSEAIL